MAVQSLLRPKSNDQKVQDLTPGQNIHSENQDYDENEHSDDIATFKKEIGIGKDEPGDQDKK